MSLVHLSDNLLLVCMNYDQRFLELGHEIPRATPSVPNGCNFELYRQVGDVLYLSGNGPFWGEDIPAEFIGKLGESVTPTQGYNAARLTAINLLLTLREAVQTLDNVAQIVSVDGLVNCTPDFTNQSFVINGCSDLLVNIFGEEGRHTRKASGTNALAFGICVEISLMARVRI